MVKVIGDYEFCEECLIFISNGDLTFLDFCYSPEKAEKREKEIIEGIERIEGHLYADGESREFSVSPCDGCGDKLAGKRYGAIALK